MSEVSRLYMFDRNEDDLLSERNLLFWRSLIGHVKSDRSIATDDVVVDLGCHNGGLLSLVVDSFNPKKVIGIEPMKKARRIAEERLREKNVDVQIQDKDKWSNIEESSVGLLLCHEVIPFFDNLEDVLKNIHKILKPGGFAYFVSGCHTENPLWQGWKLDLEEQGHLVHDYSPIDFMNAGASIGLSPAVRPLRDSGWSHYNPCDQDQFKYPTVSLLLDHQFKHKLLFRFHRQL